MNKEEIPTGWRVEYFKECPCCSIETIVLTQGGEGEYKTEIFIRCTCGEYLEFNLPVN